MMIISKREKKEIDNLFKKVMALRIQSKSYWNYIFKLQSLGNKYTFSVAEKLCSSKKKSNRLIGINVISQLFTIKKSSKENIHKRLYRRESINVIKKFLNSQDEDILLATIYGLGHLNTSNIGQLIGKFSNHKKSKIRFAVAFALGGDESNTAINKLITLTKDKDPIIRDWATFSLGNIGERDTSIIREALFQRVKDRDANTRNEAIIGLAKRKDIRVIDIIQNEIETENPWGSIFEAIVEYPKREYLPALKNHWNKASKKERNEKFWFSLLNDAIKACNSIRK
ncbi:MAG: HEAT repeat domain-containing protein [Anaerolineales bacterium]|nr:HEAT repeat domain-containing protein [Anaerolineales bacterium]